jgi:hypothetical protein
MLKQLCPMIAAAVLISGILAMPAIFDEAINNAGQKDIITIKNYNTGASLTEAYTDIDHLQRETQVKTGGYWQEANNSDALEDVESSGKSPVAGQAGGLEASINSNVIGKAHIAWQSYDPIVSRMGRHQLLGRSVKDLTGVFSIEKFIQLWSGSPPGEISIEWLPCS